MLTDHILSWLPHALRTRDGGLVRLHADALGDRDIDRFFVHIRPDEHATFLRDLPPLFVALRDAFISSA